MAACAKCGAQLPSDGPGFCPVCGAAVGTSAIPPVAASPAMGYATVPPPRSSNTALKVVLIVIACVVGLGILAVAGFGYLGYRAVHNAGFSVNSGSSVSSADLGVDPYPNGTAIEHGSVRMKIAGHEMVTATYTTSDPPEAVVNYFKGKLGENAVVNESGRGTTLQGVSSTPDEHLVVTVEPNGNGGTKIAIVREAKAGL